MSALQKTAETSAPIHNVISRRWSPRAFDSSPVEPEKLISLFEAARWAASSYNAQPWFFIVATKDDSDRFKKILDCFVEFNQSWAKNAPVLALSVARLKFEHNGEPNRHAFHDVGQAAATLALQAPNLAFRSTKWPAFFRTKHARFSASPKDTKLSLVSPSAIPAITHRSRINCASGKSNRARANRSRHSFLLASGERSRRSSSREPDGGFEG